VNHLGGLAGKLRELGYRLTPQRAMTLAVIEGSRDHISAEEIYDQVAARYPRVNISTIYRTLELLKRLGLIYEVDLGEGLIRYHPEERGHHHHLVCRKCGAVIDVGESVLFPLQAVLLQAFGFSAELRHMAISGLCEKCRE
jgi:Fur family ferric uptake transcriptional regulator